MPWGTRRDSSRNPRFIQKLDRLYSSDSGEVSILDLGCSGGGFVRDVLDFGWFAIGLEGSDYSRKMRRAEWAVIPEKLFTCDVTKPFTIEVSQGEDTSLAPFRFNVVTSWELIEHIAKPDLEPLADNVKRHLRDDGIWILSVSPNPEVINGVVLHQTVENAEWWEEKFKSVGFYNQPKLVEYFNTQFVRGPKFGAPGSFHLALTTRATYEQSVPVLSIGARIFDAWHGSFLQRLLQNLILGRSL
jgi:SAM-dependent methyltransferase